MKALAIYEQPHAEWLGECYVEEGTECFVIRLRYW
jgi:hypothetical protein